MWIRAAAGGLPSPSPDRREARAMKRTMSSNLQARSPLTVPRLSWRSSFWSVAFSFFCVTAFSTVPSSLYGLYEKQEGFSSLTVTFAYAIYAAGALVSLLLVGH